MRKLKNSILHAFPPIYFWPCLGKCPSPVVLLNPVRVSVMLRRSICADLSFWLQPLLWAAFGKETSNNASQLLSALAWKAWWLCCWGRCWKIVATIKFLLQAHLGICCSIEKKTVTLISSYEHEKMASPSLQGRRERSGEENSWKPPPLPPELFFASDRERWDEQSWSISAAGCGSDPKMHPQEKTMRA